MKKIKTYDEFLNLTVDEANDLVHDAMRMNKVNYVLDLTKWIARVQTEHVLNFIEVDIDEAVTLYQYARGNDGNKNTQIFDEME